MKHPQRYYRQGKKTVWPYERTRTSRRALQLKSK
jgi:hypothetical protein